MEEGELRAHTRCWCRRQGSNGEQGRALFFFLFVGFVLFCFVYRDRVSLWFWSLSWN